MPGASEKQVVAAKLMSPVILVAVVVMAARGNSIFIHLQASAVTSNRLSASETLALVVTRSSRCVSPRRLCHAQCAAIQYSNGNRDTCGLADFRAKKRTTVAHVVLLFL